MIDSYLEQPHARTLLAGRDPENTARAAPVLVFLFALLAGLFAGGPQLRAEEQVSTEPIATVNINTADAETIAAELKGVGLSKAKAIVEYRKKHGPFQNPDDLSLVKGIGERTVDLNRSDIQVSTAKK